MHNKKKNFITKPMDAASVIILKFHSKGQYVLMGRRPENSKFMPGVYVFPGGVTDKDDFIINKNSILKSQPYKHKLKTRNERHSSAIFNTAIRETYEETGLYLSCKAKRNYNPQHLKGIFKDNFNKFSLVPNPEKLTFFGRAITPAFLKKRFHARFFLSFFNDFNGIIKSNGELEDLNWFDLLEAKKKNIADVTEFMLDRLIDLDGNFNLLGDNFSYPMFTWRKKKKWVKWECFT